MTISHFFHTIVTGAENDAQKLWIQVEGKILGVTQHTQAELEAEYEKAKEEALVIRESYNAAVEKFHALQQALGKTPPTT
jgi:hypothetical protein